MPQRVNSLTTSWMQKCIKILIIEKMNSKLIIILFKLLVDWSICISWKFLIVILSHKICCWTITTDLKLWILAYLICTSKDSYFLLLVDLPATHHLKWLKVSNMTLNLLMSGHLVSFYFLWSLQNFHLRMIILLYFMGK